MEIVSIPALFLFDGAISVNYSSAVFKARCDYL